MRIGDQRSVKTGDEKVVATTRKSEVMRRGEYADTCDVKFEVYNGKKRVFRVKRACEVRAGGRGIEMVVGGGDGWREERMLNVHRFALQKGGECVGGDAVMTVRMSGSARRWRENSTVECNYRQDGQR